MKFVLVDLDTSYFTRPDELESIYAPLRGLLPIHLGVVPFHVGTGEYVPAGADPARRHPLAENGELMDYLRERGDFRVFLHGYDHARREFSRPDGIGRRLWEARRAVEAWFDVRVKWFMPPNGGLCREGMSALHGEGLNVIGRFSFDPRRSERTYGPATLWEFARRQIFLRRHPDLPFTSMLRSSGVWEMDCMWLMPGDSEEKLAAAAQGVRETGGTMCLATHYWELRRDAGLRDALVRFVRRLAGVEFPEMDALCP